VAQLIVAPLQGHLHTNIYSDLDVPAGIL